MVFRDITPLLAHGPSLRAAIEAMIEPFAGTFDVVAGVEARGFLLAGFAASVTGAGLIPIRKAGKLPRPVASADYALEYATATIEMQCDAPEGARVLLMDDVLATGGTLRAARSLVEEVGYTPVGITAMLELPDLGGRRNLGSGIPVHAVFAY